MTVVGVAVVLTKLDTAENILAVIFLEIFYAVGLMIKDR
jgi:hypothetical protein